MVPDFLYHLKVTQAPWRRRFKEENMKKLTLLAAGAFLALSATATLAQDAKDYVLNTASTGGTYHPVGTAISTLTKVKLLPKEKFSLTAVNSAGSGANVQAMGAGTADFAILQGLFGSYAATGTGPITEPQENLRSVTMLWQNVEQFVVAADKAKTGTVSDLVELKGMAAGMGSQNSGTIGSNRVLLSGLGIDIDIDFELVYAGYGPTTTRWPTARLWQQAFRPVRRPARSPS
jgi:TRAP transporter TAXI family solute receptor